MYSAEQVFVCWVWFRSGCVGKAEVGQCVKHINGAGG